MKARLGLFGLALTLCALHVGRAQEPKPEDILKRVATVYQGLTSYQDTATMKIQMKMMGMEMAFDASGSLMLVKPNKMNMALTMNLPAMVGSPNMSNEIKVVSDGKQMWTYMSAGKQYTVEDAPPTLGAASAKLEGASQGMAGMGQSPGMLLYGFLLSDDVQKMLTKDVKNVKLVGREDVGGKTTYVLTWEAVSSDTGKAERQTPPPASKNLVLPLKAWVSQDEGIILQMSVDMTPMLKGVFEAFAGEGDGQQREQLKAMLQDAQMVLTETHKDIKLNVSIADNSFAFKPPADAKKVAKLDMGAMIPGFPGSPAGGAVSEEAPSALVGKPAPDFTLKDTAGNTVKLSQLRGKPVLLNFWAQF